MKITITGKGFRGEFATVILANDVMYVIPKDNEIYTICKGGYIANGLYLTEEFYNEILGTMSEIITVIIMK